jgi:hypothetical protein
LIEQARPIPLLEAPSLRFGVERSPTPNRLNT